MLSYGLSRAVGWVTTIVLAHLLEPEDFGLMALAVLVIALVSQFTGLGLASSLVVRRDLGRRGEGTVLTLVLLSRAAAAAAMVAFAPLVADWFEQPELKNILYALSVVAFLSGPSYFYTILIERELAFKMRFYVVAVQAILSGIVAIALAVAGAGVWSLVISIIVGSIVYSAGVFLVAPHRPTPAFDRASARAVLPVARGFFVQNATAFFQENMDYLAVGRLLGPTALGFYSLAYRLGDIPRAAIAHPVSKVTFPIFAQMKAHGRPVSSSFLAVLRLLALASIPLAVLMSAAAGPLVRVFFGDDWLPVIGPLSILGIWGGIRVVQVSFEWLLNSVGLAGISGRMSVIALGFHIPALILAARFGGIETVAWVMLGSTCFFLSLLSYSTARAVGISLTQQVRTISTVVFAGAGAWFVCRGVVALLAAPPALELVTSVAAGMGVYVAIVLALEPNLIRTAKEVASRMLRRTSTESA
jgi:O-antigen/teichoic acid export membrane protein